MGTHNELDNETGRQTCLAFLPCITGNAATREGIHCVSARATILTQVRRALVHVWCDAWKTKAEY